MLYHTYKCTHEIECLSDIAYDKHHYLFPISLTLLVCCLIYPIIITIPLQLVFIPIITGLSLIGVSLTPYKDSITKYKIHFSCAILSMIGCEVLWILKGPWFIPILFCIASLRNKWLLGLEMGLLTSMFLYNLI